MKPQKRPFQRFRKLQWKLTFSYTLTTTLVWVVFALLIFSLTFWNLQSRIPTMVGEGAEQFALDIAPYMTRTHANSDTVMKQLRKTEDQNRLSEMQISYRSAIIVVDMQGKAVASLGSDKFPNGTAMQQKLPAQAVAHLRFLFLPDYTYADPDQQTSREANDTMIGVMPVLEDNDTVKGAVILIAYHPQISQTFFTTILPGIGGFTIFLLIFGAICGTIFGFFSARGFTRRFKRLSVVVDNWSTGNFSTFTKDAASDEIGQLARQLNRMAEQLQNLLDTRQKLAALEERNRLARDLHDSVKQQVFAISLQIRAARRTLVRDAPAAQVRLSEAEELVRQAQQELTALIRELRPVALEGKGLAQALQELIASWSQRTGILTSIEVGNELPVPPLLEEALYRIVQEALSNVTRHSAAHTVQIHLEYRQEDMTLRIADDGKGFDIEAVREQGVGLHSMSERMHAFGGRVNIESVIGKGTMLTIYCQRKFEILSK